MKCLIVSAAAVFSMGLGFAQAQGEGINGGPVNVPAANKKGAEYGT